MEDAGLVLSTFPKLSTDRIWLMTSYYFFNDDHAQNLNRTKIYFIIITLLFSIEWTDHKISCNRSETFDKLVSVFCIASKVCRVISTKKCSRESERCLHDEWEIEIYIFESSLMTFCTKDEGVLTVIRLFS